MPKYSREEFDTQYKKLPQILREALFDADIAEKIFEAGKSAGLTVDKIGVLSDEIGGVILGIAKPSDFVKNLSESLGVDIEKARDMAGRINHEIFIPLRDVLKSTHQFDISGETIQRGESSARKSVTIEKPASASLPATASAAAGATMGRPEQRLGRELIEEHELTPKAPPPSTTFRPRPTDAASPAKPLTPASTHSGFLSPDILHPLQSKPPIEVKPSITPPKLPPNVVIGIPQRPATSAPRPDTEPQPKPAGTGAAPSWAVKPAEKPLPTTTPEPATAPKIPYTNITAGKPVDEALNLEDEIRRALEGLDKNKFTPPASATPATPVSPPINIPPLPQIPQNKIPEDKPIDLRSQYKPIIPPHSPKVPPINLRDQGIKNTEPNTPAPQTPKITPGTTFKPPVAPVLPPSLAPKINPLSSIPSAAADKPAEALLMQKIPSSANTVENKPAGETKPAEKKMPSSGTDKYREPFEQ